MHGNGKEALQDFDWISERTQSQIISLFSAFCQLATIQAWLMKTCAAIV